MIKQIVALLKNNLTVPVYMDLVPESVTTPAVALTNVAFDKGRVLSGKSTGKSSVWRVTVVATQPDDVQSVMDQLDNMDNTVSPDFQRIFTDLVMYEPKQPKEPFRRAFVDVTVYHR